jgi:hypothetical protein
VSLQYALLPGNIESGFFCSVLALLVALFYQLDRKSVCVDFDRSHMAIYQVAVGSGGVIIETLANSVDNKRFDLGCWDTANGSGIFRLALSQRWWKVVAIFLAPFTGGARRHSIAAVVEDAAHQRRLGVCPCGRMICPLFIKLALDGFDSFRSRIGGCSPGRISPLKATSPIVIVDPVQYTPMIGERFLNEMGR